MENQVAEVFGQLRPYKKIFLDIFHAVKRIGDKNPIPIAA
jgi:hypothetical protein